MTRFFEVMIEEVLGILPEMEMRDASGSFTGFEAVFRRLSELNYNVPYAEYFYSQSRLQKPVWLILAKTQLRIFKQNVDDAAVYQFIHTH